MHCKHCQAQIVTKVERETGVMQWVGAAVCLFFGCWMGCCLIPFCIDDWKDSTHNCPNCNVLIGKYKSPNF